MTREADLNELLHSLFSVDELRRLIVLESSEAEISIDDLPESGSSAKDWFFNIVELLKRRGLIDGAFFKSLAGARPRRAHDILQVRSKWLRGAKVSPGELWAEGRYQLESQLGSGGFGTIWKAIDQHTGTVVALKILLEQHANDRRARQRFFRGATTLASLSHPSIVRIVSSVEQEDLRFFYAMEFVDGDTLHTFVKSKPKERLMDYILAVGDALQYVHSKGLLHRDIKPSNIIITGKRQVKLIDFDLVTGENFAKLTTTGLGTVLYAPPEAITDEEKTPAYDVFSLARTAAFVLRGRDPTSEELVDADPTRSLPTTNSVKRVLRDGLEQDYRLRTQTAKEFCDRLRPALRETDIIEGLASPSHVPSTYQSNTTAEDTRKPSPRGRPCYTIQIKHSNGSTESKTFYQRKVTLGREASDIILKDKRVSRRHGEFHFDGHQLFYLNISKSNGSQVIHGPANRDGQHQAAEREPIGDIVLKPDMTLCVGNTTIQIRDGLFDQHSEDTFINNPDAHRPSIFYFTTPEDQRVTAAAKGCLRILEGRSTIRYFEGSGAPGPQSPADLHIPGNDSIVVIAMSSSFLCSDFYMSDAFTRILDDAKQRDARIILLLLEPFQLGKFPQFEKHEIFDTISTPAGSLDDRELIQYMASLAKDLDASISRLPIDGQ